MKGFYTKQKGIKDTLDTEDNIAEDFIDGKDLEDYFDPITVKEED